MSFHDSLRNEFAELARLPEDAIDIIHAGLLIGRLAYPRLDEIAYRQYLDETAQKLGSRLGKTAEIGGRIAALNTIMFEDEGFQGDSQHYFNPDNSFLNRVIDRRRGIPITLSVLYIEIGRMAGLNLSGIPLPGHFITALFNESGRLYIDPFNKGEILTEQECLNRIKKPPVEASQLDIQQVPPASKRDILSRMLRNLKAVYVHTQRDINALEVLHWILSLNPDATAELRERGLIYEALGNLHQARLDLERYISLVPEAGDREHIERKIQAFRENPQWLH